MDFALGPQHEEIRRTVRDFAEREIVPVADELERKGEFPHEIIRKAAELGLLGVPYPEELGGTGLDSLAYAITVEELSRASGSVGIIVSAHTSLGCNPVYLAGTDEQKERYLRPMASGQVLGAYGLTEPGAGSDSRGTRTRARLVDDCWVLNGSKRFITNAGVAGTYIVTAVTDREADSGRISAFIVEADAPGFSIGRMEEKMGLHASNTGELLFDDCRIPPRTCSARRARATSSSSRRSTAAGSGSAPWRWGWRRPPTRRHRPMRRSDSSSTGRSPRSRAWPSRSPTWRPRSTPRG